MYILEVIEIEYQWPSPVAIFTTAATAQRYIDSRHPDQTDRTLTPWPAAEEETMYEVTIGDVMYFLSLMPVDIEA